MKRTYAVIKRHFHAGQVLVTSVARASLQNLIAHVSITTSHNSEPFIDGHVKSGSSSKFGKIING